MNRNKLIELFISNLSNVIIHSILERAIEQPEIVNVYQKEMKNSLDISKAYREKINTLNKTFPEKDIDYIKNKIKRKVQSELLLRISKGYKNINLNLIDEKTNSILEELKII